MNMEFGISITVAITMIGFIFWFGNWYGQVNADRHSFKEFMREVRGDIKNILERLPSTTTESKSPVSLNKIGEQIAKRLDATTWAKNEAEILSKEIKGKDALAIQEIAFQHAQTFEPSSDFLKDMQASAHERGVSLSSVRDVLGVALRDALLANHEHSQHRAG